MNDIFFYLAMIFITLISFLISRYLYKWYPIFIFNPVIFGSFCVIVILLSLHLTYESYMSGAKAIHQLLGPAVVALAFPLYKQRQILAKYFLPIISGMLGGIFVSVYSGLLVINLISASEEIIPSFVTKNITTAIAIQVTEHLNGVSSLSAVFVLIAGCTGVIVGPMLIKWFGLKTPLGRGMAFGSASHAIGTTKAFEYDENTGSISSAAMILTAIFASFIIPLIM